MRWRIKASPLSECGWARPLGTAEIYWSCSGLCTCPSNTAPSIHSDGVDGQKDGQFVGVATTRERRCTSLRGPPDSNGSLDLAKGALTQRCRAKPPSSRRSRGDCTEVAFPQGEPGTSGGHQRGHQPAKTGDLATDRISAQAAETEDVVDLNLGKVTHSSISSAQSP